MNLTPPNPLFEKEGETEENLSSLKRRAFEICLAVYRVTKLFPKGEALGNLLREISSKIAAALAAKQTSDIMLDIEAAKIYLAIAKEQNWLKSDILDLLENAYCGLAEAVERFLKSKGFGREQMAGVPLPAKTLKKQIAQNNLGGDDQKRVQRRQARIVNFLKESGPAKTSDIVDFLGDVVDRTIRTDLSVLIEKGVVKKNGNTKTARYHLL